MCENCKNNCDCHKEYTVSYMQVENWIGSDTERESLIYMIKQLANGEYTPDDLKTDIQDYE